MTSTPRLAAIAAAIFISGLTASASAMQTQEFAVDCTRGQTITKALELGDERKPLVLTVRGTCNENITISRDDVTLQGDPASGAIIKAQNSAAVTITVRGTRVIISRLTVMGGGNGIFVLGVPAFTVTNSVIQHSARDGIYVVSSYARILGNTIQYSGGHAISLWMANARVERNQISLNKSAGVHIERKSAVSTGGNTINSNGSNGIELYGGSWGGITGDTITANGTNLGDRGNGVFVSFSSADVNNGNIITNNREAGVAADASGVSVAYNSITGNGGGVSGYLGSILAVTENAISNNKSAGVVLSTNSTGQLSGGTIQSNLADGILLALGSKVQLVGPTINSTGNAGYGIECKDGESSVTDLVLLNGTVSPNCTGY